MKISWEIDNEDSDRQTRIRMKLNIVPIVIDSDVSCWLYILDASKKSLSNLKRKIYVKERCVYHENIIYLAVKKSKWICSTRSNESSHIDKIHDHIRSSLYKSFACW